jgi:hypothetical protein
MINPIPYVYGYSPVVTTCITYFSILKLHFAHRVYLCVSYGSHNKRLFLYTALAD